MGYCDYLYKRENIIGYSGDLKSNPTVYFLTESRDEQGNIKTQTVKGVAQILFQNGHITQSHPNQNNIGREKMQESYSYSIMNAGADKISGFAEGEITEPRLQECYHQSEIPVDDVRYFSLPIVRRIYGGLNRPFEIPVLWLAINPFLPIH